MKAQGIIKPPTTLKKLIALEYKKKKKKLDSLPQSHIDHMFWLVHLFFSLILVPGFWLVHLNRKKKIEEIIAYLDYDLSLSFVQSKIASCSND